MRAVLDAESAEREQVGLGLLERPHGLWTGFVGPPRPSRSARCAPTSSTPNASSAAKAPAGYHEFEPSWPTPSDTTLANRSAPAPRLAALTAATGLRELYESDEARALPSPPKAIELLALVERVIAFARAGLEENAAA